MNKKAKPVKVDKKKKRLYTQEFKQGYIHFQGLDDQWLNKDWINRMLAKEGELGVLTKADREFLVDLRDRAFFVTGEKEEAVDHCLSQRIGWQAAFLKPEYALRNLL